MEMKFGTVIKFNDQKYVVMYVEDNYALINPVGSKEGEGMLVVQFGKTKLSTVKDKEILARITKNILEKIN